MGGLPSTLIKKNPKLFSRKHALKHACNTIDDNQVTYGSHKKTRNDSHSNDCQTPKDQKCLKNSKKMHSLDEFLIIAYSKSDCFHALSELLNQYSSRSFISEYILKESPFLHDLLEHVSCVQEPIVQINSDYNIASGIFHQQRM
jgi:hypothetical protein